MLLNFGKCKAYIQDTGTWMEDTVLGTTLTEKDIGVTTSADMKVSEQCGIAASKVIKFLG